MKIADIERPKGVIPNVDHSEDSRHVVKMTGQNFHREHRLPRRDDVDRRAEDACRLASFRRAGFGRRLDHATQACGLARQHRHDLSVTADATTVDPRNAGLKREIVHQEPRLEVIRAVENEIDVASQFANVVAIDVRDNRFQFDRTVDASQLLNGGDRLRHLSSDVVFIEQHLALQIGCLDKIAINDPQMSDAGASQCLG